MAQSTQLSPDSRLSKALVAALSESLVRGHDVAIPGLGTVRLMHRSARLERQPDGRICLTPPRKEITFHSE